MVKDERPTVWSSQEGDLRKKKSQKTEVWSLPPAQQMVYLHRESKGRGGKTVTLVKNLVLTDKDMKILLKILKQACGSGGTIKDGVIEIQGDQRGKIMAVLRKFGYKTKYAGG
jgi:translation initiation factor 1